MRGHRGVIPLGNAAALSGIVAEIARAGDYVVCLGAGDITAWANDLPAALQAEAC